MYVSCPLPTQGAFSKGNDKAKIMIFKKKGKKTIKKVKVPVENSVAYPHLHASNV
jgi:hypothetical protein